MSFFKRLFGKPPTPDPTPSATNTSESTPLISVKEVEHVFAAGMRSFFKERERADRRRFWKRFFVSAIVILGAFSYISSIEKSVKVDDRPYAKKFTGVPSGAGVGKVYFIKLEGTIGGGFFADQEQDNTVLYIKEALENALEEKHLAGIVLNIDSPGGGATASAQIYRLLKKFKAAHPDIPLYSYVSDGAYSGGYYSALGTERIIVDPEATIANIGVIASYYNTSRLGKMIGVTEEEFATGPNKGVGAQWRKITPDNRKMILANIDAKFQRFLLAVNESRRIPLEDLRREAKEPLGRTSGAWFAAETALEKNLIDEIIPAEDFFVTYAPRFAARNKFKEIEYIRYQPKAALTAQVTRRASSAARSLFRGILEEAMKSNGELRMERD